jgi:hypothetical protein
MGPDARCLDILAATMKEEGDNQPSAALMHNCLSNFIDGATASDTFPSDVV